MPGNECLILVFIPWKSLFLAIEFQPLKEVLAELVFFPSQISDFTKSVVLKV